MRGSSIGRYARVEYTQWASVSTQFVRDDDLENNDQEVTTSVQV